MKSFLHIIIFRTDDELCYTMSIFLFTKLKMADNYRRDQTRAHVAIVTSSGRGHTLYETPVLYYTWFKGYEVRRPTVCSCVRSSRFS